MNLYNIGFLFRVTCYLCKYFKIIFLRSFLIRNVVDLRVRFSTSTEMSVFEMYLDV